MPLGLVGCVAYGRRVALSQAPTAEHHEHVPSARVARWVDRAVGYRLAGFPPGVHIGMPSGTVTLVVPFDDPLTVADGGGLPRPFGSVLAGLSTAPAHIHHDGNQAGVQLALRPEAVRVLFGCPAGELAEHSYELGDVLGPSAARLREQLHEVGSWAERFDLIEQALVDSAGAHERRRGAASETGEAWRVIRATGGTTAIRAVAAHVGWSMRRLQEQFRAEFGITPKEAARLRRFERSVALVAADRMPLTDIALHCGWSDHAHMDRDWRVFAGTSPSRWRIVDALADGADPGGGGPAAGR